METSLERVNERISLRSLSIKEFDVRNELSRSRRMQRSISNVSDRVLRYNRKAFTLALDIRERVEERRNLREFRYVIENKLLTEQRDLQTDKRHTDRICNNNIRLLENQLRLNERENPNRSIYRTSRYVKIVERVIRISRTNIGNDNHQRLRRVSNEKDFTNNKNYTRKTVEDHEMRLNKKIQVKKFMTLKQKTTSTSEKRYSILEFLDRKGFNNHKIQYGNSVFEIKWHYLFCALQIIYLCSILMQMPKNNEENKHKNR
ncbi:unnamed protein product [Euphydryas editha]|uniref:Uncharacterized protein n=1 Tax=Euphydryas editha TaxID=104508 RepID=A0AAU9U420_EUPED|nr:unnamed protein product [Euphydryas editha]